MKKIKLENLLYSKGYVSIEALIVAGLIIASGAFFITKFAIKGKGISDKSNNSLIKSKTILDSNNYGQGGKKNTGISIPKVPQKPPTDSKYFTSKDIEGGIEITDYSSKGPKDVVIPSEIDGKKVISIGDEAFRSKELTSVVIPNTVKEIKGYSNSGNTDYNYGAFQNNKLKEIVIPDSVTYIGVNVFDYNELSKITFGKNVKTIDSYAFRNNKLTNITIPESVKEINGHAFSNNKIKHVIIPNKTEIRHYGTPAFDKGVVIDRK